MGVIYVLGYTVILSSLLPFIILFLKKRQSVSIVFKLFLLELTVANLINLFLFLFTNINQNSLFSVHLYLTTFLILLTVNSIIVLNIFFRISIYFLLLLQTIIFIIFLQIEPENRFTYFGIYSNVLLSFVSVVVLFDRYNKSNHVSLFNDFGFNVYSAVLLYNGLQFYVLILNRIVRENVNELFLYTWPFIQVSSILYHLMLTRALWKLNN